MNWLKRARCEIGGVSTDITANSANGNPTAAMTVPESVRWQERAASIDSNGSALPAWMQESEAIREAFEERAAIMEHDGGMSRDDAERAAWIIVAKQRLIH